MGKRSYEPQVRWSRLSVAGLATHSSGASSGVPRPTVNDPEHNHTTEQVGYVAFASAGVLAATARGDLDGDGVIGPIDVTMLIGAFGPCDGPCPADLDGDGEVGPSDLMRLLGR